MLSDRRSDRVATPRDVPPCQVDDLRGEPLAGGERLDDFLHVDVVVPPGPLLSLGLDPLPLFRARLVLQVLPPGVLLAGRHRVRALRARFNRSTSARLNTDRPAT